MNTTRSKHTRSIERILLFLFESFLEFEFFLLFCSSSSSSSSSNHHRARVRDVGVRLAELFLLPHQHEQLRFRAGPDVIPDAVATRVRAATDRYQRIFVGYGDCGTGGQLDAVCKELGVDRLPGDHCYEFLAGSEAFADLHAEELGTFFLTDTMKQSDRERV